MSGLLARETVTVASQAADAQGRHWRGEATFTANGDGAVDLDQSAPVSGSYGGADGMGLFWSMRPPTGDPDQAWFSPGSPEVAGAFEVRLTVTAAGREIAARTLTRQWTATGVTHRTLTLGADGAAGVLFLPPRGAVSRPGVLLLGGSEGGVGRKYDAALLASHGHPALALGYFGVPGLPETLREIPLEYFVTAARLLRAQPGADPGGVVVNGYSRGSEAALLLAESYPDLVRGAILYAPNDTVWPGFPNGGSAWTIGGAPVPRTAIPVTHVAGPVLAIGGGEDRVWRSTAQAQRIMQRLDDAQVTTAHQALIYPDAGHGVGSFPYLAAGTSQISPGTDVARTLGGTRDADAAARSDGWPKVLAFLAA
ncbi:acyl-CoA thioesterase/BAAT N-terminal domain-containing protein [Micromonospora sp. U56]|nr:acyl-CoA thioesterase/BAAT N-terminal domain-containing protein [Micromonospora sp. U56]